MRGQYEEQMHGPRVQRTQRPFAALRVWCCLAIGLTIIAGGCGGGGESTTVPTPTPLPPAPALERPTYTVERGTIERTIDPNGRVTPVDLVQLSFRRSGRVEHINVQRDDTVQAGAILAELIQDDEIDDLREAEDSLAQAQRDLQNAQIQKEQRVQRAQNSLAQAQRNYQQAQDDKADQVEQARKDLADAVEDLNRMMPGGAEDLTYDAQQELNAAQRTLKETRDNASKSKTDAEHALIEATEALKEAQQAYSDAYWDKDWVERYGTDPIEEEIVSADPETGETGTRHKPLDHREKEDYWRSFEQAEEDLRKAERNLELAEREVELAREEEIYEVQEAEREVEEAQRELDEIVQGRSEQVVQQQRVIEEKQKALREAEEITFDDEQTAIDNAQLDVEEAMADSFNTEIQQVERAERQLERAQKEVDNGRIIAPQQGQILAIKIREGDQVEEFDPVIELADPSQLEIAAELSGEQMRQLAEGQPAEIHLLSRPDVIMPAVVRRMPAPYGSGGSGIVQGDDNTTRFEITDTKGQTLEPGAVAKIRIVLERKEGVLLLPPEAIRSFEGRTFVVVREGEREQRMSVKTGIETPDHVEITEGLQEGDVVVGQ